MRDRIGVFKTTSGLILCLSLAGCTFQKSSSYLNKKSDTTPAIIGGEEITPESALPASHAILFNRMTTEVCTVTVLNNQFALTAAHCVANVEPKNLYVIFDLKLKTTSPYRRVVDSKVSQYYNPEAKVDATNTGDIALVRFSGGVPKGYEPAKFLPKPGLLVNGAKVIVAGYGVTENETRSGSGTLRATTLKIAAEKFSQTEITLDQRYSSGACHGDSGGPAYLQYEGRYFLWGVISRSINPDNCSESAIITNAILYLPWMKEVIISMGNKKIVPLPDEGPLFPDDDEDFLN